MNYYNTTSSETLNYIKDLIDKKKAEENTENPDKKKILKLNQQILMKGLEIPFFFNVNNYKKY